MNWTHACVDPLQGKLFCNFTAFTGYTYIFHMAASCQTEVINKRRKEVLVFSASLFIDSGATIKGRQYLQRTKLHLWWPYGWGLGGGRTKGMLET